MCAVRSLKHAAVGDHLVSPFWISDLVQRALVHSYPSPGIDSCIIECPLDPVRNTIRMASLILDCITDHQSWMSVFEEIGDEYSEYWS